VDRKGSGCNREELIGSAEPVLPITALTDMSILAKRMDFVARGEPKRSRRDRGSHAAPFQLSKRPSVSTAAIIGRGMKWMASGINRSLLVGKLLLGYNINPSLLILGESVFSHCVLICQLMKAPKWPMSVTATVTMTKIKTATIVKAHDPRSGTGCLALPVTVP
jgi:hypothetical protein